MVLCIVSSKMVPGATVRVIIEGLGVKPASSVEGTDPTRERQIHWNSIIWAETN